MAGHLYKNFSCCSFILNPLKKASSLFLQVMMPYTFYLTASRLIPVGKGNGLRLHTSLCCNLCCEIVNLLLKAFAGFKTNEFLNGKLSAVFFSNLLNIFGNG